MKIFKIFNLYFILIHSSSLLGMLQTFPPDSSITEFIHLIVVGSGTFAYTSGNSSSHDRPNEVTL